MKLRLPSPAMVVAVIALIVALSGTAIAAVDFARNAGAVDGKSAVGAKASLRSAAGKLVATSTGGNGKVTETQAAQVTKAANWRSSVGSVMRSALSPPLRAGSRKYAVQCAISC